METRVAVRLIEKGVRGASPAAQTWADLGAGTGVFTNALATLLGSGSMLYAIDKNVRALAKIKLDTPRVTLKRIQIDLNKEIGVDKVDGVLMANSLHFVFDQLSFLQKVRKVLNTSGRIIVVEYDRDTSTPWVPYPISYKNLEKLVADAGFSSLVKLAETPSLYHQANLYSALILPK